MPQGGERCITNSNGSRILLESSEVDYPAILTNSYKSKRSLISTNESDINVLRSIAILLPNLNWDISTDPCSNSWNGVECEELNGKAYVSIINFPQDGARLEGKYIYIYFKKYLVAQYVIYHDIMFIKDTKICLCFLYIYLHLIMV